MKLVVLLIVVGIGLIGLVRLLEKTSIFYPRTDVTLTPAQMGLAYEDVTITTSDRVALNGWLLKAPRARATLLFFHGNAGNNSDRLEKLHAFNQLGVNVLIVDYRGYGKSAGHPSEAGIYRDGMAAWDFVAARPDLKSLPIVVYGESLGGVVAIDLATRRPVAALIIDSSFSSAGDMAHILYPTLPSFLMSVRMDSAAKIRKITVPKLFLHSVEDNVIPYRIGRKLYDAAAEPKEFIALQGAHNDGYAVSHDVYWGGIKSFLGRLNLLP